MKNLLAAFLVFGTLSTVGLPAQADSVSIQDNEQTSITTGTGNINTQQSRQDIQAYPSRSGNNRGNVQRNQQLSDTLGSGNDSLQQNDQTIRQTSPRRRSH